MTSIAGLYAFGLTQTDSGFTITRPLQLTNEGTYYRYTISDQFSSVEDDLSILGDIAQDGFVAESGPITHQLVYISKPDGDLGFIGKTNTYFYYLFSFGSQIYEVGDTITPVSASFALCFTSGTRIQLRRGAIAIDDLAIGDEVVTSSGTGRTVVWIGRRTIACTGDYAHMAPVRVRTNAFGDGVPERDVFLSPGHPVLVKQGGEEVLVPIMNLINGTTIERTTMSRITYWHVELDQHDVLLADGLPAESFFDMGSRGWFDHDLDDALANPDLVPAGLHGRCREVAIDGPLVEAERKRLADLFYANLSAQCAWPSAGAYAAA
ncbi:Hint domain-containing protein [Jiella pacifica]|uniref:Hint domain-containing protein n=1 Tax=Jiella pacifica TaxID=2696469 RepID=A0A6N9T6U4_9HYPH|nr:Hint domain-containing protein [Jiella pacifica]NDW07031.1 hypothetical protein [Jiella pacifica]